ncbi:MAG: hypothetical protein JWO60_2633 [Frankiales bacterium]|nr:hypothetical protein [Frankiales bacterium]
MGLFSRKHSDAVPSGDEPGASTTQFDDGKGTIGLADRLGDGAPDTNQGKAEPMPPTPGHGDPSGTGPHTDPPQVPELGDMSAGRALSQVASPTVLSTPHVAPGLSAPTPTPPSEGTVPAEDRPGTGTSSSTGDGSGPELPESQTTGTAHRAPGQQGETPDGESIESDTGAAAARMAPGGGPDQRPAPPAGQPGDGRGVPVLSETPADGTSEEQAIVQGVKDPAREG